MGFDVTNVEIIILDVFKVCPESSDRALELIDFLSNSNYIIFYINEINANSFFLSTALVVLLFSL